MNGDPIVGISEEPERTHEMLRRSNERIRISLQLLDQDVPAFARRRPVPICKNCNVGMTWSRSVLDGATQQTIVNIFVCSACGTITETETRAKLHFDSKTVLERGI
jgi:hypothetical protein